MDDLVVHVDNIQINGIENITDIKNLIDSCTGITKDNKDHYEVAGAGHYGIFAGRRWREKVYPKISSFIRSHQSSKKSSARNKAA